MKTIARFVGVAMVLGLVAGAVAPAQAAMTQAEMTAMIAALQQQLAALTGTSSTTTTTSTTFTTDLTVGSRGAQVVALQNWLISKKYLAAGNNTGYFGALTRSAVAQWQLAAGITPAAGYFGPKSRAAANVAASTTTTTTTDTTTTTTTGGTTSTLSGGDGDFNDFNLLSSPSNKQVDEGTSEKVLGFDFKAQDSDLAIKRVNLVISSTSRPWKAFEKINLYSGTKKVASIDASSKSDWDENGNDYSISFNNLNVVVKEDARATFYVEVEAQSSLNNSEFGAWTIALDGTDAVRAVNAQGVNVYEGSTATKTFRVTTISANVDVTTDDTDNEDMSVEVDNNNQTNDVVLYTSDFRSRDGDNTITEVSATFATTTSPLGSTLANLYLYIDGKQVASESPTLSGTVTFQDFDDVMVKEDDSVSIVIKADANSSDEFTAGATVQVSGITVTYSDVNDDEHSDTGTAGGIITFSENAINVTEASAGESSAYSANDESQGLYKVEFKVSAPKDEDIFIPTGATTTATTSVGARFSVLDTNNNPVSNATSTVSNRYLTLVSGGSEQGSYFKISKGNTATLRLTVILSNTGNPEQSVKVGLTAVNYKPTNTSQTTEVYTAGLDENFRTDPLLLKSANITN